MMMPKSKSQPNISPNGELHTNEFLSGLAQRNGKQIANYNSVQLNTNSSEQNKSVNKSDKDLQPDIDINQGKNYWQILPVRADLMCEIYKFLTPKELVQQI